MKNKKLRWIKETSTGKVVLLTLTVFILFTIFVLPWQARISEEKTAGAASPDTSFYYTPEDLFNIAEEYGEEGRQAYIQARYTFDVIWPLVYMSFLTAGISWFGQQLPKQSKPWLIAPLFPVFGAVFDYLENLATSLVMGYYPLQLGFAAGLAPIFTLIKWLLIMLSFGLYFLGLVLYLVQLLRPAKK